MSKISPLIVLLILAIIGWQWIGRNFSQMSPAKSGVVMLKIPTASNKSVGYYERFSLGTDAFTILKNLTERQGISLSYDKRGDYLFVYKIGQMGNQISGCNLVFQINGQETLDSPDRYYPKPDDVIAWILNCENSQLK